MTESTSFVVMDFGTSVHARSIDLTMYRHVLDADLVTADISTRNPSAPHGLGVRQALRPCTTTSVAGDRITCLLAEESVVDWMRESTARQLDALRRLLGPSPLEMIGAR